jgi:hypothetical protein
MDEALRKQWPLVAQDQKISEVVSPVRRLNRRGIVQLKFSRIPKQ